MQEAAAVLGTWVDAVRMRARRGSLESDKDPDGRVYVWVEAQPAPLRRVRREARAGKARLGIPDLLVALFLLIAGLKFTFALENFWPLWLYDESDYLYAGVKLPAFGLPNAEYSPLYALWYYALSLLQPDRIALYFLNYKVLTILPSILAFFLLRRYRVSLIVSVVISGVFLISNANLPVWPKPAHFALVIILVFFIAASYTKRATHGILLVCLGALLSSYIRPEFFLAYLLLLSLYIVFVVLGRDKASLSRELIAFGVVALISVLLLSTLGIPAFAGEGDRNFVAFSQHFALNWVTWTGSDLDPWADYAQITSEHFGDARSMLEALQNNPALFLKHTTSNFVGGINELTILFLPNGAFSSGDLPHTTFEPYLLEGLLGLYIAYRFAYRLATGSMSGVRSNIAEHKTLLLLLSPFVLTGLASAILIYPRDHYLLIPGLFIVIAAALLAVGDPGKLEETKYRQVVCIGVLVVLLTPAIANGDATDKSYIETINFIKSLGIEEQVNLLEAEGGFNFYLADNFRSLSVDEKDTNFSEFLEEKDINMIVVTDRLEQKMKLSDAEEWQWFVDDHYRDLGYEKISIPDTTWELIIKKGILE